MMEVLQILLIVRIGISKMIIRGNFVHVHVATLLAVSTKTFSSVPHRGGLMVRVSTSHTEGRGSRPGWVIPNSDSELLIQTIYNNKGNRCVKL